MRTFTPAKPQGKAARSLGVLAVLAFLMSWVSFGAARSAHADPPNNVTVSGTVTTSGGAPVAGVHVTLATDPGGVASGDTSTASDGHYSVDVAPGTYAITFDAGASSGLQPLTLSGEVISANTDISVSLLPSGPPRHIVSGTIRDANGNALAGWGVSMDNGVSSGGQTTLSDGSFSFSIVEGPETIRLYGTDGTSLNMGTADIQADQTINLVVPYVPLTIHVVDVNGNPVTTGSLSLSPMQNVSFDNAPYGTATGTMGFTNAAVDSSSIVVTLLPGSFGGYDVGYYYDGVGDNYPFTLPDITLGTNEVTWTLPALPTRHIVSGVLNDNSGHPLAGWGVSFDNGVSGNAGTTDGTGTFSLSTVEGSETVRVYNASSTVYVTLGTVDVESDETLNFVVPFIPLTIHVVDQDGNAVTSGQIVIPTMSSVNFDNGNLGQATGYTTLQQLAITSNATVFTQLRGTFSDGAVGTFYGDSGNNYTFPLPSDLTGPTDLTWTLPAPPTRHVASGTLKDGNGNPLAGWGVSLDNGFQSGGQTTTADGSFSFSVVDGPETVRLYGPDATSLIMGTIDIESDQTLNLVVPFVPLTIHVVDHAGNPVTTGSVYIPGMPSVSFDNGAFGMATGSTPAVNPLADSASIVVQVLPGSFNDGQQGFYYNGLGDNYPFTLPNVITGPTTIVINIGYVGPDTTAPAVTGFATTAANAAGWNNGDVTVNWTATDDSGSATTPAPTTVSTEGAGQVVTSDQSCDPAGNCATGSVTVSIDKTAPTISAAATPAANGAGWNKGDVTVTFTCADALSGVASCPSPVTVHEGANQIISGTAADVADNTASTSVTLNVDKTAPTITASASPAANAAGWNKSAVTVTFTCSDALSGVASCPSPVTVPQGAGQVVSGMATDVAGNSVSTSVTLNVDKTAPTISASVSQAANANGWNNGNVTVAFTCADALSGIATCPSPVVLTNDGANQIVTGTAIDVAGNSATAQVSVSIDKTKPMIAAVAAPAANAAGWNKTNVTVTYTCGDSLSGIQTCPSPVTVSTEGANQVISGTATDKAGNSASVSVTLNVDKTAPTVGTPTASQTTLIFPGSVTVSAAVTDTLSGAVAAEYYVDTDPGVGNGHAMTVSGSTASASVAISGNPASTHVVGVRTRDKAGNWSTVKTVSIFLVL